MSGDDEGSAYAAALSGLPGMGPATLVSLLGAWTPKETWNRVGAGSLTRPDRRGDRLRAQRTWALPGLEGPPPEKVPSWADTARRVDPQRWWEPIAARGIQVTWRGASTYPAALTSDPEPPGVLFWRGALDRLDLPCVAIVGTRQASPDGRAVAFELGRDLSAAGICVVSGLALGIDGAAHGGVLSVDPGAEAAGPVGVAASGVDVPYPRSHAVLWEKVAIAGAIISETPPGRPAQAWRFPCRNRLIAGLVRMVVVVESHAGGGSLITVEQAMARGIDVRVVPGPVHSSASAGSNQLLYDGAGPVRTAQDVLDGLGMVLPSPPSQRTAGARPGKSGPVPGDVAVSPAESIARAVLLVTGWRPTSLHQIVERSGLPVARVMAALGALEDAGCVAREGDWWVRRRTRS